ncbi:MAG: class I SAM-dependent methyltransferase [Congregibacter sp.]
MAFFQKPPPDDFCLRLDTSLDACDLNAQLKRFEPWGHRIDFSNGVSTKDLATRHPFSQNTVQKVKLLAQILPFEELRGGSVLDIGCNSGHNSIYLASQYAMHPTGIDISQRHVAVSKLLSGIAGINADFLVANAETFRGPENFDVVLHLETLYHLPNPLLSLQTSYANLKKGGYLALETQVYDDPRDQNICYFMHTHNKNHTDFWALSTHVLKTYLKIVGFREAHEVLKVGPRSLGKHMSRITLVAQK